MSDDFLVSIVVPVYNVELYIERCILSILNQTYTKIEIIIIDDGSCDKSLEICQKYANADSRIKLISKKNEGVSIARNEGLKYVNGDFLLFIDSDDWIEPNTVIRLLQKILLYDADVVVFGWVCEGEVNRRINIIDSDSVIDCNEIISRIIFDNEIYGGGYTVNKFWNYKRLRKDFCFFNEYLYAYEDKLWTIENYLLTKKILLIPDIFYHYFIRSNSLSHRVEISWNVMDNVVQAHYFIYKALSRYEDLNKIAKEKYYFEIVKLLGMAIKEKNKQEIIRYFKLFKGNTLVLFKSEYINIKYKIKAVCIYLLAYLTYLVDWIAL